MRYIQKGKVPPYHLEQRRLKGIPPEPNQAWEKFPHKEEVRNYLRPEQYDLCAYCEIRLTKEELGEHIEHIMPKSIYPDKTFEYSNLVLSCLESAVLNQYVPHELSCGHSVGKRDSQRFNPNLFISPLKTQLVKVSLAMN